MILGYEIIVRTTVDESFLDYACEHFSELREKLLKWTPEMIEMILSRDELNVSGTSPAWYLKTVELNQIEQ